ncbi:MAG: ATP-binding protein [Phycisphaerae bacterium]|nr:ATP-binding protein [Phycisphaerae bacterium]
MSIEQALVAQPRPSMLAAKLRDTYAAEVVKGCQPEIAPHPVALEPVYVPLGAAGPSECAPADVAWIAAPKTRPDDQMRLKVWVSPEQSCKWRRSELFLKQLGRVRHRVGFEIVGNGALIEILLLCQREDLPVLQAAFYGQFDRCKLTLHGDNTLGALFRSARNDVVFEDYLPPPPCSHLFTRPDELNTSPYGSIMTSLANIQSPAVGLYQIIFQPVAPNHNWHRNVELLMRLEFSLKSAIGPLPPQRLPQQMPDGELRGMAMDTEAKAHSDKPFFAAAMRVAVIGAGAFSDYALRALTTVSSLIQHGGRPLDRLTEADYRSHLPENEIRRMFLEGSTYRPGFLVNSWELTSLVHIPPADVGEHRPTSIEVLETLPPDPSVQTGTPIGICRVADRDLPVCLPTVVRKKHTHLVGGTGTGKSTVMLHMILHDINEGHGVALIDPHGPLVRELLLRIPRRHVDRVIHMNPGDKDWIPIWNPLHCGAEDVPGRLADDIVGAFRAFVTGWGHRLEHLLRQAILGVLHLPDGNLLDVADLLRKKSEESKELRERVVDLVEHRLTRSFWQKDFDGYGAADLTPPQHKLSRLLTVANESRMLSQSDSLFNFREIMDTGKILLVDLSTIGSEVREVLGCFMLALLHRSAIGRADAPETTHKAFHIYCDEAHRFITDAIEDLISETRKYGVSLTLAHQYMSQFGARKSDAVSSVGSTVIFRVNSTDASYLKKDLQDKVEVGDLCGLRQYEAVARIGTEIARLKTREAPKVPRNHFRDLIIEQSRRRYCRRVDEVKRAIEDRHSRRYGTAAQSVLDATGVAHVSELMESPGTDETYDYEQL